MPYTHLEWRPISNLVQREVFEHADAYLFEVYGMFRTLPPSDSDGGGGNFSITLVLLCVVDGLAREIWPGYQQEKNHEKRFKSLVNSKLAWGPAGKGKWVDLGNAADQLYTELRNPLVHELAGDKIASSRPAGYSEPAIAKWGRIPDHFQVIAKIDAMPHWNDAWPILYDEVDAKGRSRRELCVAALYWAVKNMAKDLI